MTDAQQFQNMVRFCAICHAAHLRQDIARDLYRYAAGNPLKIKGFNKAWAAGKIFFAETTYQGNAARQ